MKTINEIRLAAADLLESRPSAWCQGEYRRTNEDGSYAYCVIGACREAAGYYDDAAAADAAVCAAAHAAASVYAVQARALAATASDAAAAAPAAAAHAATWNDAPGRTREEVIATLRNIP